MPTRLQAPLPNASVKFYCCSGAGLGPRKNFLGKKISTQALSTKVRGRAKIRRAHRPGSICPALNLLNYQCDTKPTDSNLKQANYYRIVGY